MIEFDFDKKEDEKAQNLTAKVLQSFEIFIQELTEAGTIDPNDKEECSKILGIFLTGFGTAATYYNHVEDFYNVFDSIMEFLEHK